MYIFCKNIIEINYFLMLYALCNKVHNFGTCKHHGTMSYLTNYGQKKVHK
jgi:hypothetical protein